MKKKVPVKEIGYGRAGDKGDISNVYVIPYRGEDYELLLEKVTVEKVASEYKGLVKGDIHRYTLPEVKAINFVMEYALDGGVSKSLNIDTHGKSRASILLNANIEVPQDFTLPKRDNGEKIWVR